MSSLNTETDEAEFFALLGQDVRVTIDGNYKPIDRYRDFHATFATDAGKRVLKAIIDLCEDQMPRPSDAPAELAAYVARRRVGQRISAWTFMPPRQD